MKTILNPLANTRKIHFKKAAVLMLLFGALFSSSVYAQGGRNRGGQQRSQNSQQSNRQPANRQQSFHPQGTQTPTHNAQTFNRPAQSPGRNMQNRVPANNNTNRISRNQSTTSRQTPGWSDRNRSNNFNNNRSNGFNNNRSNGFSNNRPNNFNNNYRRQNYSAHNPSWRYANMPRRNSIIKIIPSSYRLINYGGYGYRYNDGIFYRPYNNSFMVVAPPIGLFIDILPAAASRIYVNNYPYYYYDGTYYDYRDNNYQVVSPPVGAIVESIPEGYETVTIDGETYYEVDGAQYKPEVQDNGEIWYEVIKAN